MKTLRNLSMIVLLALALGTCAAAGTIETPPAAPPPPAPDSTASSLAANLVIVLVQSVVR
jgi:hypothetical protein